MEKIIAWMKLTVTFKLSDCSEEVVKRKLLQFFERVYYTNPVVNVFLSDARSVDVDLCYKAQIREIDISLEYSDYDESFHVQDEFRRIRKEWCAVHDVAKLWLRLSNRSALRNTGKNFQPDVSIKGIAFGTLPSMHHFMDYYSLYKGQPFDPELSVSFLHSQRVLTEFFCQKHADKCHRSGLTQKIVVNYKSISRVLVDNGDTVKLYLTLKTFPFIYNEKKKIEDGEMKNKGEEKKNEGLASDQEYQAKRWERTLILGCKCYDNEVHVRDLGKCSVLKLEFANRHRISSIIERLIQRCPVNSYFFFTTIDTLQPRVSLKNFSTFFCSNELFGKPKNEADDIRFASQYAWEVIISLSHEVNHQIQLKLISCKDKNHTLLWENLKTYLKRCARNNINALTNALYDISDFIRKKEIFVFEDAFTVLYKHYSENPSRALEVPEGMCLVRRLIITPSRIIYLPPSEHFDNRVIREFGSDNMLRVSIQDDNFAKLTFAVQYHRRKTLFMAEVAANLLKSNIQIGPRIYKVLAASNSQLREHGIWMHAEDHLGRTACRIRRWMGDFSHIRNVAKYMARMGQCFSSSEEAVQIELSEEEVETRGDKTTEDGQFTFSDGIGMISEELAKDVRNALEKRTQSTTEITNIYEPTAFQIRFKGCKGMVAINKDLEGRKLVIRPSMEKFSCPNSNLLEVVKISAPRNLFLNRPLISILEQKGVPPNVFLKLQKKMVLDFTDSLIYEEKAWKMLGNLTGLDYPYKKLLRAGICLTQEPFFRSLLLSVYKVAIDLLRSKSRIAIPTDYGRNMLGVLDEHGELEYGEVFVQYSQQVGNISSPTQILEGTIVVTKNPCMHPGDVRKLKAVNKTALHHIKDCIVFPAKGKRPHPDEMAGSDLDGDEYVVLWLPDLVFPETNTEPMMYPANEEEIHEGPIQVSDMIDFLCKYVQNDNIGSMAFAHLAWADYLPEGIFSEVCMSIARKYSQALDFAKSGTTCYLESAERPKLYPDFMEKGAANSSYKSSRTLGLLYRVTRNLEGCVSKIDILNQQVEPDPLFACPDWEQYRESSELLRQEYAKRVKNILKRYGLYCETEALSGYAGRMNDYSENRHERENALQIVRTYIQDSMKRFNTKFYLACEEERQLNKVPFKEMRHRRWARASAWYMVTYTNQDKAVLSFPWILHDLLCEIRANNLGAMSDIHPHSSLIETSDKVMKERLLSCNLDLEGKCMCEVILSNTIKDWMTRSSMNLTMSADFSFCFDCFRRILRYFEQNKVRKLCCYFDKENCECVYACSPTKLIIEFMKYYATEVREEICSCDAMRNGKFCNGFREQNLQSIALKTYASLAITRDAHYLGLSEYPQTLADEDSYDEGDPIRVSVSKEFENWLNHHHDDTILQLKAFSKVKDLFITPERDAKGNWYILVHSIGISFQRYALEELIMDPDIVRLLKAEKKPS